MHQIKEYILLTLAVPKNYSTHDAVPRKKTKAKLILRKISSLEKVAVPNVTFASANVHNCSSKKLTILNE